MTRGVLAGFDAILVPGSFRADVEGKINAIRFAREQGIPYLGCALGMRTGGDRVRPQRDGAERRERHRVRPGHACSGGGADRGVEQDRTGNVERRDGSSGMAGECAGAARRTRAR